MAWFLAASSSVLKTIKPEPEQAGLTDLMVDQFMTKLVGQFMTKPVGFVPET